MRSSNVYLEERECDLDGSGFAYGGVTAAADGEYAVHFSVGVRGTYLLHVGLRQSGPGTTPNSNPLPGSPFLLRVLPGAAHPLSTSIAEALPMCGYLKPRTVGAPAHLASAGVAWSAAGAAPTSDAPRPEEATFACQLIARASMTHVAEISYHVCSDELRS